MLSDNIVVSDRISKFDQINILGQQFTSMSCRNKRGAYIQVIHPAKEGMFCIGRVLYFFTHSLSFPGEDLFCHRKNKQHVFAFVEWYQAPQNNFDSFFVHNIEVWKNSFEPLSVSSILPVQRIHTCVAITDYIDNCILAIPLPRKTIGT
ncbi:uncharacterized protein BX663DRAFT_444653 [Cokeromyces recurvatus]|uniref:uncharacterized protein n=1 Tax=Cokeromyces recurvatus TaxID=90255 RepID=UPI002220DF99|nr:uncharacterized protein BX663DRAFT_444653 [Cokeromyces recurvatus]KAI7897643.1 hypothetical protein BX663DRAFT_444653 [Cokeromyces recurvatus]